MRIFKALAVLGVVVSLGACEIFDPELEVDNTNAPDQSRALSEPGDIESLIGSTFNVWWYGYSYTYPAWTLAVAADENSSSWGNFGMRDINEEPRKAYNNDTGYSYRGVNQTPWYDMYQTVSSANDGLRAIKGGIQIGNNGADTQRAIAFGKFMQAMGHAYLALTFDRMFLFTEDMDLENAGNFELTDYKTVMTEAIKMMDQAIVEAGKGSFTLPANWIPYGSAITNQDLIKIMNSYTARFMAAVARTPAERAAVNWTEVINRINKGITQDFGIMLDNTDWYDLYKNYTQRFDWFRADMKAVGPSDISGAYQAWLALAPADRMDVDLNTPDKRIQGAAPRTDGTDFFYRAAQNFRADRGTYHFSRYGHKRFLSIRQTNLGFAPIMPLVEMDLLKAEAHIRLNQPDLAVPLINKTRVARGGLPPVTVNGPTGADCVPKKLFTAAGGCASLLETLQYEKRIELFSVVAGGAYFDARGWGTLLVGTPVHFPIAATELETLNLPPYTFGGVGGEGAAK